MAGEAYRLHERSATRLSPVPFLGPLHLFIPPRAEEEPENAPGEARRHRNVSAPAALSRHVRQTGKSLRTIESELAWGHGTLGNVLRGRSEIRLHHVESLARVLGLKPIDLLREVYEDATGDVMTITLPEERLSTLIREAVASALESSEGQQPRPSTDQPA